MDRLEKLSKNPWRTLLRVGPGRGRRERGHRKCTFQSVPRYYQRKKTRPLSESGKKKVTGGLPLEYVDNKISNFRRSHPMLSSCMAVMHVGTIHQPALGEHKTRTFVASQLCRTKRGIAIKSQTMSLSKDKDNGTPLHSNKQLRSCDDCVTTSFNPPSVRLNTYIAYLHFTLALTKLLFTMASRIPQPQITDIEKHGVTGYTTRIVQATLGTATGIPRAAIKNPKSSLQAPRPDARVEYNRREALIAPGYQTDDEIRFGILCSLNPNVDRSAAVAGE